MTRALVLALVLCAGCNCYDDAYAKYCVMHPCAGQGGGEAGGGTGGGGAVEDAGIDAGVDAGVDAGPPPSNAFTLQAQAVVNAAACGSGNVVLISGTTNLPLMAAADLPVALDGGPSVVFFAATDAGCLGTATPTVTIPAGQTSVDFNFRSDAFGELALNAYSPLIIDGNASVTSNALARLIGTTDIIPMGAGCPVQMTLRVVDIDTKAIPVPALIDSDVKFVATGNSIGFGTSTCASATGFTGTLAKGQSALIFYAGPGGNPTCGNSADLTLSSTGLAKGLVIDTSASELLLFYLKFPTLAPCTSDPQCCNGTCSMSQCN